MTHFIFQLWFTFTVDPFVNFQSFRSSKSFVTHIANVWILFWHGWYWGCTSKQSSILKDNYETDYLQNFKTFCVIHQIHLFKLWNYIMVCNSDCKVQTSGSDSLNVSYIRIRWMRQVMNNYKQEETLFLFITWMAHRKMLLLHLMSFLFYQLFQSPDPFDHDSEALFLVCHY